LRATCNEPFPANGLLNGKVTRQLVIVHKLFSRRLVNITGSVIIRANIA